MHPYWWKWACVNQFGNRPSLVMWLDVDCVLINPDRPLSELSSKIDFSQDGNGLCCGAFLAAGGKWLVDFSSALMTVGPDDSCHDNNRGQDQGAAKHLSTWGQYRTAFGKMPIDNISNNSHDPEKVKPIFHHIWASAGLEQTINRARDLRDRYATSFLRPSSSSAGSRGHAVLHGA